MLDFTVAPLAGSVDRNYIPSEIPGLPGVAPLAGSVDRNTVDQPYTGDLDVAPLAGSVDRNNVSMSAYVDVPSRSPCRECG